MGIIDDLVQKGRLKNASVSDEMVKKELEIGKKDYIFALSRIHYLKN